MSPTCSVCGATLSDQNAVLIQGKQKNSPPVTMCTRCVAEAEQTFQAETEEKNLPGGILGGIAGAMLSAIAWYLVVVATDMQIGYLAVAVGWIVGQAVMFGAGGKRGPELQVVSLVFTLVGMALSEYMIVRHFLNEVLLEEGLITENLPILIPLRDTIEVIVEGIKADPLTLLFWAIAIFIGLGVPAKRQVKKVAA